CLFFFKQKTTYDILRCLVGSVKLVADGKTVAEFPVVALQPVPEAGLLGRIWDSILLMFSKKK
ncbi:hypothetical protein GR165_36720, partial [Burkholderia sp. 4812]|nr:hypothetical protein [Burkholderia sp. 4812]